MGKLLLVACTNVGRYIIETFYRNPEIGAELVGVVNLNRQQAMNKANYDAYEDLAAKYGFPIFYCDNINDRECVDFMRALEPDIILQSGWSQKFLDEVLSIPVYGCIGEHPAPLPRGRGAACVNWAILTGETKWGDSYFRMVSEYDKGELYAQRLFDITAYDTVYTIYEKVARCAVEVVTEWAARWTRGEFEVVVQDDSKATYYKRRRPTDGEIRTFDQPACVLSRFIRAQTHPYPGAYIESKAGKILLLACEEKTDRTTDFAPGTVFEKTEGGILVACGDHSVLEIKRVKKDGYPSCWASDWFVSAELPISLYEMEAY